MQIAPMCILDGKIPGQSLNYLQIFIGFSGILTRETEPTHATIISGASGLEKR